MHGVLGEPLTALTIHCAPRLSPLFSRARMHRTAYKTPYRISLLSTTRKVILMPGNYPTDPHSPKYPPGTMSCTYDQLPAPESGRSPEDFTMFIIYSTFWIRCTPSIPEACPSGSQLCRLYFTRLPRLRARDLGSSLPQASLPER